MGWGVVGMLALKERRPQARGTLQEQVLLSQRSLGGRQCCAEGWGSPLQHTHTDPTGTDCGPTAHLPPVWPNLVKSSGQVRSYLNTQDFKKLALKVPVLRCLVIERLCWK